MKGLASFFRQHRLVALDTSILIYQLEANARYLHLTDDIFSWLERHDSKALTSTITMTELLVQPYRSSDPHLVDEFYGLLSIYPNLRWVAPNLEIADLAARFRARHNLKTPHALQAATAVHARATALITNDGIFQRVEEFQTLVLDSLL